MRPKDIKIRVNNGHGTLSVLGYKSKSYLPYLCIEMSANKGGSLYGYVQDRDIKRLKKWCEDCLRKRK